MTDDAARAPEVHDGDPIAAPAPLVLASASETRARLLTAAGLAFLRDPADIDEAALKDLCRSRGETGERAAVTLAEAKAQTVAQRRPGSLVVGSDQLMVAGDTWFDKPADRSTARATLAGLRGRRHKLISGVAVARDDRVLWWHVEVAHLEMRDYSDAFLDWYLDAAGESILQVVGACRLEGLGAQLFARIEGDYFTILGLPLLPLLDFLRREGALAR